MGLSCLSDEKSPIVGDASTVINLNATGCALSILRAIPNRFIVTDVVLEELREDVRSGRNDAELVASLIADGLVNVAAVDSLMNGDFERLVSGGTATTLDDGEAATIAYAVENQMVALIDERKAHRICQSQYPNLLVGSTMDLLALGEVEEAIGRVGLADAVHSALVGARTRVLPKYLEWTITLIGEDRAHKCESLPRHLRKPNTDSQ